MSEKNPFSLISAVLGMLPMMKLPTSETDCNDLSAWRVKEMHPEMLTAEDIVERTLAVKEVIKEIERVATGTPKKWCRIENCPGYAMGADGPLKGRDLCRAHWETQESFAAAKRHEDVELEMHARALFLTDPEIVEFISRKGEADFRTFIDTSPFLNVTFGQGPLGKAAEVAWNRNELGCRERARSRARAIMSIFRSAAK